MKPLSEGAPENPESIASMRVLLVALDARSPDVLVPLNNRYGMFVHFPLPNGEVGIGSLMQYFPKQSQCTIVKQSPHESESDSIHHGRRSRLFNFADIQTLNPHLHFDIHPEKTVDFSPVKLCKVHSGKYIPIDPQKIWVKRSKIQSPETGYLQQGDMLCYSERPDSNGHNAKKFIVDVGNGEWYAIAPDNLAQLNPDLDLFLDGEKMAVQPMPILPPNIVTATQPLEERGPTPPKQTPDSTMTRSRWSIGGLLDRLRGKQP